MGSTGVVKLCMYCQLTPHLQTAGSQPREALLISHSPQLERRGTGTLMDPSLRWLLVTPVPMTPLWAGKSQPWTTLLATRTACLQQSICWADVVRLKTAPTRLEMQAALAVVRDGFDCISRPFYGLKPDSSCLDSSTCNTRKRGTCLKRRERPWP